MGDYPEGHKVVAPTLCNKLYEKEALIHNEEYEEVYVEEEKEAAAAHARHIDHKLKR